MFKESQNLQNNEFSLNDEELLNNTAQNRMRIFQAFKKAGDKLSLEEFFILEELYKKYDRELLSIFRQIESGDINARDFCFARLADILVNSTIEIEDYLSDKPVSKWIASGWVELEEYLQKMIFKEIEKLIHIDKGKEDLIAKDILFVLKVLKTTPKYKELIPSETYYDFQKTAASIINLNGPSAELNRDGDCNVADRNFNKREIIDTFFDSTARLNFADSKTLDELKSVFELDRDYFIDSYFKRLPISYFRMQTKILYLTYWIGAEETRKEIIERLERTEEYSRARKCMEQAYSFITPNYNKRSIINLQNFYQEKIKFEDYKINEKMNEKEIALLAGAEGRPGLINKSDKALEMGCGTGRLMLALKKAGIDITGYDFTPRHIELVKEQDGEAKVFQGDWHNNAVKDGSFDKIYSLGRNILHDYSLPDQVQLFREAARMLKPGGRFIFDIPDREKGGYRELVEAYASEMKERGVRNFRKGAIYDSPDGKNFTTRYAFSHQDIQELAKLAGFRIVEVKKEELATGKGDENLYYALEKA